MAIEVVATQRGYINGTVVEPGEMFTVPSEQKVSKRWMVRADSPEHEAFITKMNRATPTERDKIKSELATHGGIAEELAIVTAERNKLRSQVAELTAENRLMRAKLESAVVEAPTPASDEVDEEAASRAAAPKQVRRRTRTAKE